MTLGRRNLVYDTFQSSNSSESATDAVKLPAMAVTEITDSPVSQIVIPARLASTRLPRKLLLDETGKTVLQHTYEASGQSRLASGITIAVDSPEMEAAARSFGAQVVQTSPDLPSGTDRAAVVARELAGVDIIVNVQGDEPEIEPSAIDQVIQLLTDCPDAPIATLATPIRDRQALENPACVKVVCDASGYALYFSRSAIPFVREWSDDILQQDPPRFLQHLGLYAYRRDFLLELSSIRPSLLEQAERLEQLRFMDAGMRIRVGITASATKGIDTIDDYRAFVSRWQTAS